MDSDTQELWSKPPIDIARDIFTETPRNADGERFLNKVIWNFTGFPCFWQTDDAESCFRQQLQEYHDDPEGVEARQEAALNEMLEDMRRREPNAVIEDMRKSR